MYEVVVSFIVGVGMGLVFSLLKLPPMAPQAFSGVIGIVGIYVGSRLIG